MLFYEISIKITELFDRIIYSFLSDVMVYISDHIISSAALLESHTGL